MHGVCWGYWNLISIHAPPRGATPPSLLSRSAIPISIHAPPRGATSRYRQERDHPDISIHAPPRGATLLVVFGAIVTIISIHAPPRGATCITASSNSSSAFQFTPLREGRRATKQGGGSVYDISIHAPPRGATAVQHGGADARHFNSRPSARGDQIHRLKAIANISISIHAPPRGATSLLCKSHDAALFQFTPLREGRRGVYRASGRSGNHFNSRPSARGDSNEMRKLQTNLISIHAPPRGATEETNDKLNENQFQFTPLREGRRATVSTNRDDLVFQFTPLREGRQAIEDEKKALEISIHAPPRGATARFWLASTTYANFNSRPSARGDQRQRWLDY